MTKPRTSSDDTKDKVVNVRYTLKDYALVVDNAQKSGLTVSQWIRKTSTKTPSKKVKQIPPINRHLYLQLSASLIEFSEFLKLLKHDKKFKDLSNEVIEKTLVKIVSQIFEVKKKLI